MEWSFCSSSVSWSNSRKVVRGDYSWCCLTWLHSCYPWETLGCLCGQQPCLLRYSQPLNLGTATLAWHGQSQEPAYSWGENSSVQEITAWARRGRWKTGPFVGHWGLWALHLIASNMCCLRVLKDICIKRWGRGCSSSAGDEPLMFKVTQQKF